jgi:hypothetical protein
VVLDVIDKVDALRPLTLYFPMAQRPLTARRSIILRAAGDVDAARVTALGTAPARCAVDDDDDEEA